MEEDEAKKIFKMLHVGFLGGEKIIHYHFIEAVNVFRKIPN